MKYAVLETNQLPSDCDRASRCGRQQIQHLLLIRLIEADPAPFLQKENKH